jgi:hypothetical protein
MALEATEPEVCDRNPHHASLAQRVGSGMEFGCRWRWQDGWLGVTV